MAVKLDDFAELMETFWSLNVQVGKLRRDAVEFSPPELPVRPPPATAKELAALEKRMGVPVPPSYKALLLAGNGGRVAHECIQAFGSTTEIAGPAVATHMEGWHHRTREPMPKGTVIGWNLYANSLLLLDTHLKPKANGEYSVRYWARSSEEEHRYPSFAAFLEELVEGFRVEASELGQRIEDARGPATFSALLENAASMLTSGKNGRKAAWKALGKDLEIVVEFMEALELAAFPSKSEKKTVSAALRRLGVPMFADELEAATPANDGLLSLQIEMHGCFEYIWRVLFGRFDLPDNVASWLRWGMYIAIRGDEEAGIGPGLDDDDDDDDDDGYDDDE
jgi:hypothetical protein